MDDFKFYEVGGKIRDELLGLTNKDDKMETKQLIICRVTSQNIYLTGRILQLLEYVEERYYSCYKM